MRGPPPLHLALGCVAAALGILALVSLLSGESTSRPSASAGDGSGHADPESTVTSFTIAGDTHRPLSPGRTVPLNLRVTNPNSFPLAATDFRVSVRSVDAPRATASHPCTLADFAVVQASGSLLARVPAHATTSLRRLQLSRGQWPRVGMLDTNVNQDGCKGASLMLRYRASALAGR